MESSPYQNLVNKKIEINKVIDLLNSEMWYPSSKPDEHEYEVAKHLNAILADIITKLYRL